MPKYFAYVGCRTTRERDARGVGISTYAIKDDGSWHVVDVLAPLENPSFLILNREQDVLYSVHGDGSEVSAYRLDSQTGKPVALGRQSCAGRNPVHLTLTRDGASLLVANYATGNLVGFPIQLNGQLAEVSTLATFTGEPGPHRVEQGASHPHQVQRYVNIEHDSDWYIVPDKGLDTLFAIRWEGGNVAPLVRAFRSREGAGPRHAAFHPRLPLVYVTNEIDSTVTIWRFDIQTGELNPLRTVPVIPGSYHGFNRAAGIAIHPNEHALYVSNRGHDSVCTLSLNEETGMPSFSHWEPTAGCYPRFLCLDPDASFLYVANELSDSIVQYVIDAKSGMPAPTGKIVATGSPVCIVFKSH